MREPRRRYCATQTGRCTQRSVVAVIANASRGPAPRGLLPTCSVDRARPLNHGAIGHGRSCHESGLLLLTVTATKS
jgi:hypothetical protein